MDPFLNNFNNYPPEQRAGLLEYWRFRDVEPWRVLTNNGIADLRVNKLAKVDYDSDKTQLEDWKKATSLGIEQLEGGKKGTDSSIKKLEDWKTKADPRLKSFEDWKTKTDPRLTALEDKTTKCDTWRTSTDAQIKDLEKTKMSFHAYNTDRNKIIDGMSSFSKELANVKGGAAAEISSIKGRLDSLEGKATDIEGRISGHDKKFKTYDDEFIKVRKEVKDGNDKLGKRIDEQGKKIDEQGKKMDDGFKVILDKLNSPGRGKGNGGSQSLTPFLSNNNSPGGINVANYGPLIPSWDRSSPWGLSPSPLPGRLLLPAAGTDDYSPILARRTRSHFDSDDGSSNYNYTPNITLQLERMTGGGLFSKPKMEGMLMELGRGGGGGESRRRRHRSKNDHLFSS